MTSILQFYTIQLEQYTLATSVRYSYIDIQIQTDQNRLYLRMMHLSGSYPVTPKIAGMYSFHLPFGFCFIPLNISKEFSIFRNLRFGGLLVTVK
jgi:hypothetical protein